MHPTDSKTGARIPDIWLKAAMLGSLWASVEIILGSFLHNIHMPFSGTFLASLGVIIMINGYRLWPDRGLFWRTALITAAMKSISPSAIIFGPMVGIFMEGLILESSVRLFRGRWPGFIIGGAIAVSWSLFQKIFVLLMTYGPDFVKLYEQLYFMAAKSLQFGDTVPFDLVKAIFIIDLCFGALVAALAYRTNGAKKTIQLAEMSVENGDPFPPNQLTASTAQRYSVPLLYLNLTVLIAGLNLLDELSIIWAGLVVATYVALNIYRYNRSLRRLKRPQLWIQLFAIMGLSGLLLGGWESQTAILSGLETGLGMATRALLVIFGFSALSIEIRNPVIIAWFTRHGMGIAFEALSLAFEVLPRLIKLVSGKQRIWRYPFKTLNQLLGALEVLRREHTDSTSRVVILTGIQGDGKTELVKALIRSAQTNHISFAGFYSEGTWLDNERDRYQIVDITTGSSELLCDRDDPKSEQQAGPFSFRKPGLAYGCEILKSIPARDKSMVIIDEIGHLELKNSGWSGCMDNLMARQQPMLWTVRPSLLDDVVAKWNIHPLILSAKETNLETLMTCINSLFSDE